MMQKLPKHNEECLALWQGKYVIIEKIYWGRRGNAGMIMAKIIDDTKVHYVPFSEITIR